MYKGILCCIALLLLNCISYSQSWTWVNGSNLLNPLPVYGTQGVTTVSNSPGGRGYATSCYDTATGTFWLFGGWPTSAFINNSSCYTQDLWKYEQATNMWTWMKGANTFNSPGVYGTQGVSSPLNNPGARTSGVMWVDGTGNLWLFGGFGYIGNGLGSLNDLWKYDIGTNEWTWMKGSNNHNNIGNYGVQGTPGPLNNPPARHGARAFKDPQGNLCLFGGLSQFQTPSFYRNDIWKYEIITNEWTWIKGSNIGSQFGSYGTLGVSSVTNNPGGRACPTLWQDNNSDIWIFGGIGLSADSGGYLNDLWKYKWSTNEWTWVKGNHHLVNQAGVYGTMGFSNASNLPCTRWGCASWTDNAGDLWLFGGVGFTSSTSSTGDFCDLWKYEVSSNSFVWKKGPNTVWSTGNFGTQGIASPLNFPSGREQSQYWKDTSGNFWLFGGQGGGELGDLWRLPQCTVSNIPITGSNNSVCEGGALILSASGAATYTWSNSQTTSSTVVWPANNPTYTLTGDDMVGCSYSSTIAIAVTPNLLGIVSTNSAICLGEFAVLTATGCIAYNWSTSVIGPSISVSPSLSSVYQASGFDATGCTFSRSYSLAVSPCTGIVNLFNQENPFSIFPNPNNGTFKVHNNSGKETVLIITDGLGKQVLEHEINLGINEINTVQLAKGFYFYTLLGNNKKTKPSILVIE